MQDVTENYRPISILPTISKIYERHIAAQIHEYFKRTNVIHNTQSGFRKDHSCHTALTRLLDTWIKDINSGIVIGTVFLDLRKAFDLVDHSILYTSLNYIISLKERFPFLNPIFPTENSKLVKVGNTQTSVQFYENTVWCTAGLYPWSNFIFLYISMILLIHFQI